MTRRPRRPGRGADADGAPRLLLAGPLAALLAAPLAALLAVLLGALLAVLLPTVVAGPVAAAAPGPTSGPIQSPLPVWVAVSTLEPHAPRPGDVLRVSGTLTATTGEALHDLSVRVRVGGRLGTRGELRQADEVPPAYRGGEQQALPDLPPGSTAPLDLSVPVDRLRLAEPGVYPLQIEVRGSRGPSSARERLGQVATYLPWFGTTVVDPLRIAWVWPVVDQPRRRPDGALVDDALAASFAPGGRLARTLEAAGAGSCPAGGGAGPATATTDPSTAAGTCTAVPVTYAVDPDLLLTASQMAGGYTVHPAGGPSRPGTGSAAAHAWLAELASAVDAGGLLALPFADPDVVAVTRSGSGLAGDVATARTYGTTVTRTVLHREPLETVALPPPGPLSDAGFDALTTGSTRAVLLGDDAVSAPAAAGRSTPGARVALPLGSAGGVTGLVVDRGLSDLLVPAAPQDPRLAEQRWLVETALVSAELPSRGRTLVVLAPRRAAVDPAVAGAAVADTGAVPWMCPVRLSAVVAAAERCPVGLSPSATPSYAPERKADLVQPDPRGSGLAPDLVGRVAAVRAAGQQLTGAVLAGGTDRAHATSVRLQEAWLRGESSAWRSDRSAGVRLVGLADDDVGALRAQVSVLPGKVLLTSRNGRVTVAVVNELELPVTVSVRLTAPSEARLSRVQTEVLQVPARNTVQVPVDATTLTSGRFVVKAQLLDRDGAAFGAPVDLLVHSTRYGTVALAVTGVGLAVLLAAAGVRVARRALRRRPAGTRAAP